MSTAPNYAITIAEKNVQIQMCEGLKATGDNMMYDAVTGEPMPPGTVLYNSCQPEQLALGGSITATVAGAVNLLGAHYMSEATALATWDTDGVKNQPRFFGKAGLPECCLQVERKKWVDAGKRPESFIIDLGTRHKPSTQRYNARCCPPVRQDLATQLWSKVGKGIDEALQEARKELAVAEANQRGELSGASLVEQRRAARQARLANESQDDYDARMAREAAEDAAAGARAEHDIEREAHSAVADHARQEDLAAASQPTEEEIGAAASRASGRGRKAVAAKPTAPAVTTEAVSAAATASAARRATSRAAAEADLTSASATLPRKGRSAAAASTEKEVAPAPAPEPSPAPRGRAAAAAAAASERMLARGRAAEEAPAAAEEAPAAAEEAPAAAEEAPAAAEEAPAAAEEASESMAIEEDATADLDEHEDAVFQPPAPAFSLAAAIGGAALTSAATGRDSPASAVEDQRGASMQEDSDDSDDSNEEEEEEEPTASGGGFSLAAAIGGASSAAPASSGFSLAAAIGRSNGLIDPPNGKGKMSSKQAAKKAEGASKNRETAKTRLDTLVGGFETLRKEVVKEANIALLPSVNSLVEQQGSRVAKGATAEKHCGTLVKHAVSTIKGQKAEITALKAIIKDLKGADCRTPALLEAFLGGYNSYKPLKPFR